MARNFSFLKSKRFWILLAVGVVGTFSVFFSQQKEQVPVPQSLFPGEITDRVASFLYLYDVKEKTYIPETSEGWQNKDFVRHIFDVAEKSSIAQCRYFAYDSGEEKIKVFSKRECNAPITITVGEQGICSSQGKDSCVLYVYATDEEGKGGEFGIGSYSIDYELPVVGKVFARENQIYPILAEQNQQVLYTAFVSDNTEVFGCWFYGDRELIGKMKISPIPCVNNVVCEARISYALPVGQEQQLLWAQCVDQYDVVAGRYVNAGYGEAAEVVIPQNHPPRISFCRVTPVQGTIETLFTFEAQAYDPDHQELKYQWEFGDGGISDEENPQHRYKGTGVFRPKVMVQDEQKEMAECSTAWVIVQE